MIKRKEGEVENFPKNVSSRIKFQPITGEDVFAPNPEWTNGNKTGFVLSSLTGGALTSPTDFVTANCMDKPRNRTKYLEVFTRLEAEGKIVKVGKIKDDLTINFSRSGKEWLERMKFLYLWDIPRDQFRTY